MNRTFLFVSVFAVLLFSVAAPAHAAEIKFPHWGNPLITCGGESNPCTSFCDILVQAQSIIYFALTLVVLVFAPIMIAIGGFLILTAGASEENLKKGKTMLYGAVTGVAVALLAFVIVNTFLNFLDTGGDIDISLKTITCDAPETPSPRSGSW